MVAVATAAFFAYKCKKVTLSGALAGAFAAYLIYLGGGDIALVSFSVFFILGTMASSWKKSKKQSLKVAQENDGQRGVANVFANVGVAVLLAIVGMFMSIAPPFLSTLMLAVFATACSDTLSSELGTVYGKRFFSVIDFKPQRAGKDGAISLAGLFFGLMGSLAIAAVALVYGLEYSIFVVIVVSGLLGNILDSVFGATLQNRGLINNHQVNFLATGAGALVCWLMLLFL